ncbi:MAG: metallophosphoesterase [Candidatus Eisenbacteria bacterium]|uniref:Metallophosphoesterase n=1 Tax=Eiseniibacteriota bacterium TaxID=2212470 RepID=A0A9D6L3I4_UNCEI|nr:metallophosphoesterase [Candidatus Eisenbacteria bacterium]MBI3539112.1 metallophosphoesterase [Candidatus Eisenbacteria bacterium]
MRLRARTLLLAAAAILAVDALLLEPNWIEVTRATVAAPIARPLTIAHLTDLHTRGVGFRERRMLAILARERPDLIVITGDITQERGSLEDALPVLAGLRAPLGVWAVRGNWEIWRPSPHERAALAAAGVRLLVNEAAPLGDSLWLAGFDDPYVGRPDVDRTLGAVPRGAWTIALFHAPALLDRIAGRVPLALAGHTHGGQVQLPFVPTFWLPGGCDGYLKGWFTRGGTRMYVSRGVGMSGPPVRFLCRPEVAIITLTPAR